MYTQVSDQRSPRNQVYVILIKLHVQLDIIVFSLYLCFVALRPKSTAMVMAGLGKLEQAVNQYFVHILLLEYDNNPS